MAEINGDRYKFDNEIVEMEREPNLRNNFKRGARDGLNDAAYSIGRILFKFSPFILTGVISYWYLKRNHPNFLDGFLNYFWGKQRVVDTEPDG